MPAPAPSPRTATTPLPIAVGDSMMIELKVLVGPAAVPLVGPS